MYIDGIYKTSDFAVDSDFKTFCNTAYEGFPYAYGQVQLPTAAKVSSFIMIASEMFAITMTLFEIRVGD